MVITFNEIMGSSARFSSANCSQRGVCSGIGQGPAGPGVVEQCLGDLHWPLPVTQWLVNHVMHLSAFVPVICLSGGDKAGRGDARPGSIVQVPPPTPHICPSFPSFSLLHDCLFCHYFLTAGGNSGNLVNPLTTNCPLLPRCLNKQNGGGGSQARPEL